MDKKLTPEQVAEVKRRHMVAMKLQEIEGNPFNAEDIAMFEMFEREGFSPDQQRAYIIEQSRKRTAAQAMKPTASTGE